MNQKPNQTSRGKISVTYELLKDLPMYPAGTLVTHTYEVLPSKFNSGTYATDGEWTTDDGVQATQYLKSLIQWCSNSQRSDDGHEEWVQIVATPPKQEVDKK